MDEATEKLVEKKVAEAMKKMNAPTLAPLKAPAQRGFPPAAPPIAHANKPMLPPPPVPLRPPQPRGLQTSAMSGPERPMTPHAKELAEKARRGIPQRPTLCPECGDSKRVNVQRDKKNAIVGYDPCPRCVEL